MILDTNLLLCNAVSFAAAAGTATTTNVIDLGAAARNPFNGEDVYAVVTITTAFLSAGASTTDFRIVTDAQDPVTTDGTATFHGSTGPIPKALLTVGARFVVSLNKLGPVSERYLGLNVTTAVATTTAGSATVDIMTTIPDTWRSYSDAVN